MKVSIGKKGVFQVFVHEKRQELKQNGWLSASSGWIPSACHMLPFYLSFSLYIKHMLVLVYRNNASGLLIKWSY